LNLPVSIADNVLQLPYIDHAEKFPGHLSPRAAADGLIDLLLQSREFGFVCQNLSPDNVLVSAATKSPQLVDWGRDIVPWTAVGEAQMLRRAFLMLRWSHRSDLKQLMRAARLEPQNVGELAGLEYLQQ